MDWGAPEDRGVPYEQLKASPGRGIPRDISIAKPAGLNVGRSTKRGKQRSSQCDRVDDVEVSS